MVKTRKRGAEGAVASKKKKVAGDADLDLVGNGRNGKQNKCETSASGKKKKLDGEKEVKKVVKRKEKSSSKFESRLLAEEQNFTDSMSDSSQLGVKCKEGMNVTSYQVEGYEEDKESEGEISEDESLSESESEADEVMIGESENNNATRKVIKCSKVVESDEELDYIDDVEDSDKNLPEPMVQMTDDEDEEEKQLAVKIKALRKQKRLARERKIKQQAKQPQPKPQATLAMVEDFCSKNGLVIQKPTFQRKSILHPALPDKRARGNLTMPKRKLIPPVVYGSPSEATVYKSAVQKANAHDGMTNRKKLDIEVENYLKQQRDQQSPFDFDGQREYVNTNLSRRLFTGCKIGEDRPLPSTSKQGGGDRESYGGSRRHRLDDYYQDSGEDQAREIIKEAEQSKARILELPGESYNKYGPFRQGNFEPRKRGCIDYTQQFIHSAMVDEQYSMVATHVDEIMYRKITNCEYVDFSKLIPRDKVWEEDNHTLELVQRGGKAVFAPTIDREVMAITSFNKWEQAFRVYSAIFTKEHPERSSELVQYNHLIYTTAQTYVWSNVYAYDKDFRIHLSNNPSRTWSLILQQAWSFRLKTKLSEIGFGNYGHGNSNRQNDRTRGKREVCYRFNRGKCSYGAKCKFEHRCQVCTKYGHGAWNCRKALGGNGQAIPKNEGKDTAEVAVKKVKNE